MKLNFLIPRSTNPSFSPPRSPASGLKYQHTPLQIEAPPKRPGRPFRSRPLIHTMFSQSRSLASYQYPAPAFTWPLKNRLAFHKSHPRCRRTAFSNRSDPARLLGSKLVPSSFNQTENVTEPVRRYSKSFCRRIMVSTDSDTRYQASSGFRL